MKKIGIITFHCADNFGAVLQAYGLRTYLISLGYSTEIINYVPDSLRNSYRLFPDSSTIERYLQSGLGYTIKNLFLERMKTLLKRIHKQYLFQKFRYNQLGITSRKIKNPIKLATLSYDIYITGSDQVWNPICTQGIDRAFYLDFVNNTSIKASYAASTGGENIEQWEIEMKELISKLDYISIREKSIQKLAQDVNGKKVDVVIDPVFLLNVNEWRKLIDSKKRFSNKFIFFYCIDNNKEAIIAANWLSKIYNMPIIHFYFGNLRKKIYKDGKCFYFDGPIDFLWYIEHAEYIVTSSFHCVAFSLIFEKKFYPFLYPGRASRIIDLLECVGLQKRINFIFSDSYRPEEDFINYQQVRIELNKQKAKSISYLKKIVNYKK